MMYRMLDENDDWVFGQGLQSFVRDEKAVETGVQVYLRTIQGEVWMDGIAVEEEGLAIQHRRRPCHALLNPQACQFARGLLSA